MPSMKEALNQWLEKQQPKSAEWLKPCQDMTEDNGLRATCLRFADDFENGKIDEVEFLASLSNITGKSLDEIDVILQRSVGEQATEHVLVKRLRELRNLHVGLSDALTKHLTKQDKAREVFISKNPGTAWPGSSEWKILMDEGKKITSQLVKVEAEMAEVKKQFTPEPGDDEPEEEPEDDEDEPEEKRNIYVEAVLPAKLKEELDKTKREAASARTAQK